MKKLLIVLAAVTAIGCAGVLGAVIPEVEAAAGANGVRLNVGVNVESFCLESEGKVNGFLNSVPVLGDVVRSLVGVCPVEESTEVQ